jgi:hypothetical protein
MSDGTIAQFWDWWREVAPQIAGAFDAGNPLTGEQIEEISSRVDSVQHGLVWEFGPGRTARHAFTVSAEGNIVLRRLSERLVRAAPAADEVWEYYPARRPIRNPSLLIAGQQFDGDDWRFGIDVDEGRLLINLTAYHPKLKKLKQEERGRAGFIAVDQMFGEDAVETWIGALSFTDRDKNARATLADVGSAIDRLHAQSKDEVFSIAKGQSGDGHPLILTFNQRLKRLHHLFADTLVEVEFVVQAPDSNGFPSSEELHDLTEIEDQLILAADDAVHVGHLTGRGVRTTYLYTEDARELSHRLEATLRAFPGSYELRSRPDPEWAWYRGGLFDQFAEFA